MGEKQYLKWYNKVADSLNQVAYKDDTQIVDAQCRKFYSVKPRIEVIIKQID